MKIAIECRSPLLQKSLENFLQGYLSSVHSSDLIITDELRPDMTDVLRIGSDSEADIKKPFSKAQLFLKLEQYFKNKETALEIMSIAQELDAQDAYEAVEEAILPTAPKTKPKESFAALEEKIERLTQQYIKGVMSLVKGHYDT